MKLRGNQRACRAFSLAELVLVIAVLSIIVAMMADYRAGTRGKVMAQRMRCVNNLKQIGLSANLWAGEHGDFPMAVPITNGGAAELYGSGEVWRTYQVMSNELTSQKVLFCPVDNDRPQPATNFGDDLRGKSAISSAETPGPTCRVPS